MNGAIGGNSRILTLIILLTLPLPLQAEEQAQEQAEKQAQQQESAPPACSDCSLVVHRKSVNSSCTVARTTAEPIAHKVCCNHSIQRPLNF